MQLREEASLPSGWTTAKLAEVLETISTVNPKEKPHKEFTYLDITSIDNATQRISQPKRYNGKDAPSRARQLIREGDILFSTVRTYLKHFAIVPEGYDGQIASTGFCVLRPSKAINGRFIFFLVQNSDFLNPLNRLQRGTNYPAVRNSDVLSQVIPLPPLQEQRRIVSKIEELFTKLDAGIDCLKKARIELKHYRQSLLKAAFEGILTEEWRKNHKDVIESGAALLQRIRGLKMAKGVSKLKLPSSSEVTAFSRLPEEWAWAIVSDIAEKLQYGTSVKADSDTSGIPVLRMGNIRDGKLDFSYLKYLPTNFPDNNNLILEDGDVLFNRTNSKELVGKTAVYRNLYPRATFASYLIRVKIIQAFYLPDLLSFFINSSFGRRYIGSVVSQQVGQANVNGSKLSLMPIPLFDIREQGILVQELERYTSVAEQNEKAIAQALAQAARLRQSVLNQAFSGKIVAQDLSDEPAEKLLERIKTIKMNPSRTRLS